MCGIVGYIGYREACPLLIDGLKKLEYRGYDSSGVALLKGENIEIFKKEGRIARLEEVLERNGGLKGIGVGIGHTRWATHGRPSDANSHPHRGCNGDFAVVHNGIIENYQRLREWLATGGHTFVSETDTEVLPHLIEHYYQGDLVQAVRQAISRVEGSYAMVVMAREEPDRMVCVRKDSPLVIGVGKKEMFIASDIPAIISHTREAIILNDGEIASLKKNQVEVFNGSGQAITKEIFQVNWEQEAAEKLGFEHFMLKEIYEQPPAITETLKNRLDLDNSRVMLEELATLGSLLREVNKIYIVACGTAYHAGLIGKYIIEKMARIPVEVDLASEFRYRDPILDPQENLVMVISQSGETADTLAALRLSRSRGAKVVAVTNVVGSSVSREADTVIYTWAGPEIAVASTKAYITQLVTMYLVATYLGQLRGTISPQEGEEMIGGLRRIPSQVQSILEQGDLIREVAQGISRQENLFFIGRGLDYAVALEGSLKLKEISYIHAEAYAAGELKHGTLALVTGGTPVIALVTQKQVYDKTISNIKEVKARDARVIAVAQKGDQDTQKEVDQVIYIPVNQGYLMPLLSVVPMQLLAYYAALIRGCDVDKPRNLAKSVTVE